MEPALENDLDVFIDDVLVGDPPGGDDNSEDDTTDEGTEYCFEVPIEPMEEEISSLLTTSINYLNSRGLNDTDIEYLLAADTDGPAMSESDLVQTTMILVAYEQNMSSNTAPAASNFIDMFGTSAYAANASFFFVSDIGQCAGEALGISAIAAAVSQGLNTAAGKALLKKAVRKAAARALAWVGAAIFVYEFGDCIGWW